MNNIQNKNKKKTILLTGCAGFIGGQILKSLVNKFYVIGIDDLSTGTKKNLIKNKMFKFIEGNCCNQKVLKKINTKIDAILHFAGQSSGEKSYINPTNDFDRNLNSTINLLEFALKNKCKQFIFASSMSVYGNSNQKVKEINKKKPISFYGISKSAAEEYVKKYSSKGLSYTILRLFNVYGKAQRLGELKQGMIRIYLTQIFKNKKLVIKGNKNRFRDFLNTLDLLEYINLILFNRKTYNQILNLGFGKKYRISELVNMLKKNNKFKFSVKYIKGTKDDQFGVVANIDKIKKITNYSPKITLDMGIKDILKN
jgi:UDP-glucose 4-epimerase